MVIGPPNPPPSDTSPIPLAGGRPAGPVHAPERFRSFSRSDQWQKDQNSAPARGPL